MGSFGFLLGPPIIGVLADAVSLPWALSTLILGAAVVFALARRAAGRAGASRRRDASTAVISDLDGVLVDSTAPTVRSWARVGASATGSTARRSRPATTAAPRAPSCRARAAAPTLDADAALLAHAETTDTDGVVALPGAADVLALPRVAIATSCTAPLARARLAAAGLPEPAVLVTSDQVEHGKPAPDPYLLAAERLGVDPAAASCSRTRPPASRPAARRA